MKLRKFTVLAFLLSLAVLLVACNDSGASSDGGNESDSSDYPNKPIQVVVPAGAGGDTDRNTRIATKYLSEELDTDVVVSNVGGAGGSVGAKQVLDSAADGYTVLAFHNSMIINDLLELADFNYEDYQLAGTSVLDLGNAFIVSADSEYTDLQSLIDAAKERPGEINIATETGAFTHLQLLAFQEATGTEFNLVDVGAAAEKNTALLGGQIDIIPTQLGLVQEYIESGDFRAVGIMADERLEGAPDVPTFAEQGVDITFDKFFFWAFPKDTPQEIVDQFTAALENVTNNADFQAELEPLLVEPLYMSPEELQAHFETLTTEYKTLHENSQ
ncbi:tripartite tricarboxylate transporter substrate binding protein [Oceanobacillus bengalensis]|uniref:Tripartite tricarboxylate transporter substrate binding protein n=1 Tax=Oceanobacillus bengalensis TaxID=1435466 RepID=A0A494YTX4_9BACI|nr:tripartite tricarboxylate transporter substrate binding protein [Oceanobacillus bengalensis]RKQ13565.1 tripartite tricarboxylate transporter substrate binding protein [Oceanobacillus bengalensis]